MSEYADKAQQSSPKNTHNNPLQQKITKNPLQRAGYTNNPLQAKGYGGNPLAPRGYVGNPLQMKSDPGNPFRVLNQSDTVAQRQVEPEEELLQGKFAPVQRMELDEEELPVQQKSVVQCQAEGEDMEELPLQGKFATSAANQQKEAPVQKKPNDTGLPDNLKNGVENLSGYSMDDVKVHYNSDKPAQLQALAYAQGTDIHVGPGQEQHLPHEAWHVVQQKQGRVQPTMQMKGGVAVNDDKGLEQEADTMGKEMINQRISFESISMQKKGSNAEVNPVKIIQRKITVHHQEFTAGELIHRLWSDIHDDSPFISHSVWHDEYRDAIFRIDQEIDEKRRSFAEMSDLILVLAGIAMHSRITPPNTNRIQSNSFMAAIVHEVTIPSAAHRLDIINQKYDKVAAHPYGWSFCLLATMQNDMQIINQYLQEIKNNNQQLPQQPVTWTWNNTLDQRVEFTVNGRTYSTHKVPGHSQLYPIRGAKVLHGLGPIDMARALRDSGQLTDEKRVKLYQVYAKINSIGVNLNPYNQLGDAQKSEYIEKMNNLI